MNKLLIMIFLMNLFLFEVVSAKEMCDEKTLTYFSPKEKRIFEHNLNLGRIRLFSIGQPLKIDKHPEKVTFLDGRIVVEFKVEKNKLLYQYSEGKALPWIDLSRVNWRGNKLIYCSKEGSYLAIRPSF